MGTLLYERGDHEGALAITRRVLEVQEQTLDPEDPVIADTLDLGPGRTARIVIRKNLAADRLLDQVILGPGVRLGDPGVRRRVDAARRSLREQVGLS